MLRIGSTLLLACVLVGTSGCAAQKLTEAAKDSLGADHVVMVSDSPSAQAAPKADAAKVYGPQLAAPQVTPSLVAEPQVAATAIAAPKTEGAIPPHLQLGTTPATSPKFEDAQAIGAALAKLQEQGTIDAATHSQLLDGLKQTDPAIWPQLLAYYQAAAMRVKPESQAKTETRPREPRAVTVEMPLEEAPDVPAPELEREMEAKKSPVKKVAKALRRKIAKPQAEVAAKAAAEKTEPAVEVDWKEQLTATISKLETETAQPPTTNAEIGKHAALRLMYLAADRRQDALKPIEGISAAQQDFWAKEVYGLAAYMDDARNPDASRRAAEATSHLREATARLGEIATLQVRNLAFCTEVTNYGVYKTFEKLEFEAGQEVLLYAEVENFKSEHSDLGYHTALKASYQILDERGARVDEKEFAVTEEHCQNPRRDFFVRYFVWMPQRIYGGKYTLQLSVEDTLSQKIGQASVEFRIKGK